MIRLCIEHRVELVEEASTTADGQLRTHMVCPKKNHIISNYAMYDTGERRIAGFVRGDTVAWSAWYEAKWKQAYRSSDRRLTGRDARGYSDEVLRRMELGEAQAALRHRRQQPAADGEQVGR